MIVPSRSFLTGALSILLSLSVICGSAWAGEVGDGSDLSTWRDYSNTESGFTFKYPKDWEAVDEGFYKTAYGVTLQKTGGGEDSNNWIRINSPQFMEQDGTCLEADRQRICTYSKDPDVLNIFEEVAASFKLNRGQQNKAVTETTGTESGR